MSDIATGAPDNINIPKNRQSRSSVVFDDKYTVNLRTLTTDFKITLDNINQDIIFRNLSGQKVYVIHSGVTSDFQTVNSPINFTNVVNATYPTAASNVATKQYVDDTSGGSIGPGTAGRLTRWATSNTVNDSSVTDDGSIVTVDVNFAVTGEANLSGLLQTDQEGSVVKMNRILPLDASDVQVVGSYFDRGIQVYSAVGIPPSSLGDIFWRRSTDNHLMHNNVDLESINNFSFVTTAASPYNITTADFVAVDVTSGSRTIVLPLASAGKRRILIGDANGAVSGSNFIIINVGLGDTLASGGFITTANTWREYFTGGGSIWYSR